MTPDAFDAVSRPRPSQQAMAEIVGVAQDEAVRVFRDRPHAAWEEEFAAWRRLADAAYVCECVLVRRHLSFTRGEPQEDIP